MTKQRWNELMRNHPPGTDLTPEERAKGWHWCIDWDGLLVGPWMPEEAGCLCE